MTSELERRLAGTMISPNLQVIFPVSVKLEPTTFTFVPPFVGPWFGSASKRKLGLK